MPPLVPLIAGGMALGTIGSLLRPKPKFPKVSTGRLRGLASARLASQQALTQANIRQTGAAGRLPSGAITSALAAAGARSPTMDPQLDLAAADIERFNVGQETRESLVGQQRFDDILNFNLAGLGALSKIAILSKYGLLNPLEEDNFGEGDQGIDFGQPGRLPARDGIMGPRAPLGTQHLRPR